MAPLTDTSGSDSRFAPGVFPHTSDQHYKTFSFVTDPGINMVDPMFVER